MDPADFHTCFLLKMRSQTCVMLTTEEAIAEVLSINPDLKPRTTTNSSASAITLFLQPYYSEEPLLGILILSCACQGRAYCEGLVNEYRRLVSDGTIPPGSLVLQGVLVPLQSMDKLLYCMQLSQRFTGHQNRSTPPGST